MNTKMIFLLFLAIGCGVIAAVAGSQMMQPPGQVTVEQKTTDIYVAAENLSHGTAITQARFKLEKWPADRLPDGAVRDIKEVEGKFTNQPLYLGEPLLLRKTMNTADFISAKIPPGYRIFDMPIGDSEYIRPGDHVDIFGYFQKSTTVSQTRSMRVLQNVTVLMVDGVTVRQVEESGTKAAKIAQLLIKDSQYEALTTASNLGKLRLALCGTNTDDAAVEGDNGEQFLDWVASTVDENGNGSRPIDPEISGTFVNTAAPSKTVPVEDNREQHSMVVYSGGIATQYTWYEDELPKTGSAPAKPLNVEPNSSAQTAPPGKFTGTNTIWDPLTEEWIESDSKGLTLPADAQKSP